ncbi:MAG: SCP2 sterol-binding domain-containing protein [Firmicutes bacterium]|nr:SCP2 sterol-binding domain-containing protein [Bacillota bacterium]
MAIAEWVETLRANIAQHPEKLSGVEGTFQFILTGEEGGAFYAQAAGGRVEVAEGQAPDPSVTITMSAEDFGELMAGRLNPMTAFMSGRLKLQGDIGLALRLQSLLG